MTFGMPVKPSRPLRKAWTAISLAALSAHGAVPPATAASRARRRHGKRAEVGLLEVEALQLDQVQRLDRQVGAVRVVQRVADRHAHVRIAHVRLRRAVAELHERVDDRLRVHDDVDRS